MLYLLFLFFTYPALSQFFFHLGFLLLFSFRRHYMCLLLFFAFHSLLQMHNFVLHYFFPFSFPNIIFLTFSSYNHSRLCFVHYYGVSLNILLLLRIQEYPFIPIQSKRPLHSFFLYGSHFLLILTYIPIFPLYTSS